MNNIERIEKIKEDNGKLINNVKEEIGTNQVSFQDNFNEVVSVLKDNNLDPKKEQNYIKIAEMVTSLVDEIKNANDLEEVTNLRKKLNYYINLVKKELKKRELEPSNLELFNNSVFDYRKSIAKYVRYLKRNNNINEIETLNNNYDSLNEEEKLNLKKLIRREQNYNNRNLNNKEKVVEKIVKTGDSILEEIKETIDCFENKEEKNNKNNEEIKIEGLNPINSLRINDEYVSSYIADYTLKNNVENHKSHYKLKEIPAYCDGKGNNILKLIKNLPTYLKNKRIISTMKSDSRVYGYEDLDGYIAYSKRRNSISLTLKEIINPRYTNVMENLYLRREECCAYWIKNIYKPARNCEKALVR